MHVIEACREHHVSCPARTLELLASAGSVATHVIGCKTSLCRCAPS